MSKSTLVIIPIVLVTLFAVFGGRMMAAGLISPVTMIIVAVVAFGLMLLIRPKKGESQASADDALQLLGDFSKGAFADDAALSKKFQAAISDYVKSMPKAAISKLEKLQPLCKTDADTYAVSVALGLAKCAAGDFYSAIKLYNKAVVIHPTSQLADAIGSAQQRIGDLDEAIDSYEFALDLDPDKIDIRARLATACVADGKFLDAIDQAQLVLDKQKDHASALATIAICHGVLSQESLYIGYTAKAVEAGYSEEKITSTVTALKKKYKKTLGSKD